MNILRQGNRYPNLAEVIALRRDIEVALNCCVWEVHFEINNKNLDDNSNGNEEERTVIRTICTFIKREAKKFHQFRVSYTCSKNNTLAHLLAKESIYSDNYQVVLKPIFIMVWNPFSWPAVVNKKNTIKDDFL